MADLVQYAPQLPPPTAEELRDDVITALVEQGYKRAAATAICSRLDFAGKDFSASFREALEEARICRSNGNGHSAPAAVTTRADSANPRSRFCKHCGRSLRSDNQHDTCSACRIGRKPAPVPAGVPSQPALAVSPVSSTAPPSDGFRLLSDEEFAASYGQRGVIRDPWKERVIARIRQLPFGQRAEVIMPPGQSVHGFRHTLSIQMKADSTCIVRVFLNKKNRRAIGVVRLKKL